MIATILGNDFEVAPEPADFWGWVKEGRYDFEWHALKRILKREHTFIDVGAWVGSHSLFASTIAHRVMAVEPDPVALKILRANVVPRSVEVWTMAIAGRTGVALLGSGLLGASTTRMNLAAGGGIGAAVADQVCTAPCTTLRDFCSIAPGPLCIKIDVEGVEEQIVEDLEFFAERKPALCLEAHPFWWKNIPETWERIYQIGALYSQMLDLKLNPITPTDRPSHLIFLP